ncbi:MAG: hypothetical protein GF347_04660 [Candidatus Moranbacteria bacterium]|nr:hypothetical protein [Candidatus Moranbacteria bacterium]
MVSLDREKELFCAIVSVLFVLDEPVEAERLGRVLNEEPKKITRAIKFYADSLEAVGLAIIKAGKKFQLAADKKNFKYLERLFDGGKKFKPGKASLEILAIVAYKPGITREQIDLIRGVNSYYTIRDLMVKGLIEYSKGDKKKLRGIYPSLKLLQTLGVRRLSELDDFQKINQNKLIDDLIGE